MFGVMSLILVCVLCLCYVVYFDGYTRKHIAELKSQRDDALQQLQYTPDGTVLSYGELVVKYVEIGLENHNLRGRVAHMPSLYGYVTEQDYVKIKERGHSDITVSGIQRGVDDNTFIYPIYIDTDVENSAVSKQEAEIAKLKEQMRWKTMTEQFPTERTHMEVIYTNPQGYRWCEVHHTTKPASDFLGLAIPVMWRELSPLPPRNES